MILVQKLLRFTTAAVVFYSAVHPPELASMARVTRPFAVAEAFAQQSQTEIRDSPEPKPGKQRQQSSLVLKDPALLRKHIWGFPVEFTAASGETVGMLRAQISFAASDWKYVKFESPRGSRLKISAKRLKRAEDKNSQEMDVTVSAGAHIVKDGVIGILQMTSLRTGETPPESPVVQILSTAPPETQEVMGPSEKPFDLPPEPPINPNVTCFFFSH
ncbi:MAG: hypothetical protein HYX72_08635 [Acidobacteria bacterium]|nr:hypothetical protein [Acidobacteriota bacterium]